MLATIPTHPHNPVGLCFHNLKKTGESSRFDVLLNSETEEKPGRSFFLLLNLENTGVKSGAVSAKVRFPVQEVPL